MPEVDDHTIEVALDGKAGAGSRRPMRSMSASTSFSVVMTPFYGGQERSSVPSSAERKSYVQDGLFELRAKFGSDITRAFYIFFVGQRVVVTCGFVKKSPKTPQREIERAFRYKRAWEEAHREDA